MEDHQILDMGVEVMLVLLVLVLLALSDPCIYVPTEGEMFVIAVHVDDTVLATKSDKRMAEVKKGLAEGFYWFYYLLRFAFTSEAKFSTRRPFLIA